ncbi:MAG TPA: transposase domain-containing protein [Streptosporangiaceae bacterium]|nr:transposase domain-containing protein [Streptosporangiaceae bacterium]
MSSYPAAGRPVCVSADEGRLPAGVTVAVRLCDLVSPLKSGAPLRDGDRSALAEAGTGEIRSGEPVAFVKIVAVAPAVVTREGQVRAAGSPCSHATLGPLEDWLDEKAGPGVIDAIAGRAVLDGRFVKGERERLLAAAFMIRVLVLMTLMPEAQLSDVITALAGDLALVPWSKPWRAASERSCLDWRKALGPAPLEELRAAVLAAAAGEHAARPGQSLVTGRSRPLSVHSADGSLLRVPDTPANRAAFGSVGTADDSAAWPAVRLFPLSDVLTRSLLAMPWGAAGTDKAAAEQGLLDEVLAKHPDVLAEDQVWLLDRLWHGVRRIAALIERTHVLIRVKSDITLKRVSEILRDGSYLAEISGDGITMTVRVIEYFVDVEGQTVPEMLCLVTDLLDWEEYPAPELAGLYKWRWDGSETGLREAKAPLHGAGPGTGAMLRSGSPELIAQEIAAWTCATEMTRGVTRAAALTAQPAVKGRRAGQPVRYRDLSLARARRLILAAIRSGKAGYKTLTSQIARFRAVVDRNRHRARKSRSPSTFGHAGPKDTITRTAPAVITMANKPAGPPRADAAPPEQSQNTADHQSGQRKPVRRRRGTSVAAAPGNRRSRNVTTRETAHQGLNA